MKIIKLIHLVSEAACIATLFSGSVLATELVYTPINPTFGGNPNNAPGLLSIAQAQNGFKAPTNTTLQNFNINLQNSILSRLSSEALTNLFGKGSTLAAGSYDTVNYTIKVTDTGGGNLVIETTDKSSGASASFTVNSGTLAQ